MFSGLLGSQGELIVYPCSVVRRRGRRRCSHFSIIAIYMHISIVVKQVYKCISQVSGERL